MKWVDVTVQGWKLKAGAPAEVALAFADWKQEQKMTSEEVEHPKSLDDMLNEALKEV